MIGPDSKQRADQWEAEYRAACDELREQLLGTDGSECALIIERWEKKYWRHPRIGPFVVNRARDLQMTLRKDPKPSVDIIVHGDHNTVQSGANISQQGSNNFAGDSITRSSAEAKALGGKWKLYTNLTAGGVAGLLAGWWLLPEYCSLGPMRNVVTATLVVASIVLGILNWLQFKRQVWEKVAYITLASILILRSAVPSVTGLLHGSAGVSADNATGAAVGYLSITDAPLLVAFQLGAAVVLLFLAFLTKPADVDA